MSHAGAIARRAVIPGSDFRASPPLPRVPPSHLIRAFPRGMSAAEVSLEARMAAVVASEVRIVFIYWIQSVSSGRDYIGITYNLSHRLLQHNGVIRGGAVATTNH
eukprot:scaffold3649_cov108-Isochrysis_galbana.AAC.8